MRTLLIAALLLLPLILVSTGVSAPVGGVDLPDTRLVIDAPEMMATGDKVTVSVYVLGGPASDVVSGTYHYEAFLIGENLSGSARPVRTTPATGDSEDGEFTFELVMPRTEQDLVLLVNATSRSGADAEEVQLEWFMQAVEPIELAVSLLNPGTVKAQDVMVDFYVDDTYVGSETIDEIAPGGLEVASYEYLITDISAGPHSFCAQISAEQTVYQDMGDGSGCPARTFYIEEEESNFLWIITISIIASTIAILAWYMFKV